MAPPVQLTAPRRRGQPALGQLVRTCTGYRWPRDWAQAAMAGNKLSMPPSWVGIVPVTSTTAVKTVSLEYRRTASRVGHLGARQVWVDLHRPKFRRLRCAALRRHTGRHTEADERSKRKHSPTYLN